MKINRLLILLLIVLPLLAACNHIKTSGDATSKGGITSWMRGLVRFDASDNEMTGKRYALVIGNSNYDGDQQIPPLNNPVNDARDMKALLEARDFEVIYLEDATTRQEMIQVVEKFVAKLASDSLGLFYYAGHAVQVNGNNYLIPTYAKLPTESEVESKTMSAQYVLDQMGNARKTGANIIILDACRDNPLLKTREIRGLERAEGLAEMRSPKGSIIGFATAPNHTASDGRGRNGTYTKHLLEALQVPGLTIEKMFKRVRVAVLTETNGEQVPWEHSSFVNEFCFSGCKAPAESQQTQQQLEEALKWAEEAKQALLEEKELEKLINQKIASAAAQGKTDEIADLRLAKLEVQKRAEEAIKKAKKAEQKARNAEQQYEKGLIMLPAM